MSPRKRILTQAMETCLKEIVKVSACDDTKKDRKMRKKICKANNVNFAEFENRYNKFKSKGGLVSCPITRPSSSSEKHKHGERSGSSNSNKQSRSSNNNKMIKKHSLTSSLNKNKSRSSSLTSGANTKKTKSSIDDIFSGLSDKKKKRKRDEEKTLSKERNAKQKKKSLYKEERSKMMPLRVDEDSGFNVYSEAALNLNKVSGGTPLCPFDCDCCF